MVVLSGFETRLVATCCLVLAGLLAGLNLHAADVSFMGIRGHEDEAKEVLGPLGLDYIEADYGVYSTDNSWVKLRESVVDRKVILYLPEIMSPDEVMDALIRVRDLKTNGAGEVGLLARSEPKVTNTKGEILKDFPFKNAFQRAGADTIRIGKRPAKKLYKHRLPKASAPQGAIIADFGHPELSKALSKRLKIPYMDMVNFPVSRWGGPRQIYLVSPSMKPANEFLVRTLEAVQVLRAQGHRVHLITPYLPYARSDKIDEKGTTVTGRLVADLIHSVGINGVTFVRAHAPQSEGFFGRGFAQNIPGREVVLEHLRKRGVDIFISPDNGFGKDAGKYVMEDALMQALESHPDADPKEAKTLAETMEKPLGVINKARDPAEPTKVRIMGVSGVTREQVFGKTVVIVDDETSSGKTLGLAAKYLKEEMGAGEVITVVTHLAGDAKEALQTYARYIDEFVVTNTLPIQGIDPDKITVLDQSREIAKNLMELEAGRLQAQDCKGNALRETLNLVRLFE